MGRGGWRTERRLNWQIEITVEEQMGSGGWIMEDRLKSRIENRGEEWRG